MKKTYIKPVLTVEHIGVCNMMAVSDPSVSLNKSGSVAAGEVDVKGENDWSFFEE